MLQARQVGRSAGNGAGPCLDLERHAKQAHWNVRGPTFKALHELFDEVAQQSEDASDLLRAPRRARWHGDAGSASWPAAARSDYPADAISGDEHVEALSRSIAAFGSVARDAIDQAAEWGDADTADVSPRYRAPG